MKDEAGDLSESESNNQVNETTVSPRVIEPVKSSGVAIRKLSYSLQD